jgi:virulence-associated protein VapD
MSHRRPKKKKYWQADCMKSLFPNTILSVREDGAAFRGAGDNSRRGRSGSMYAIVFDLDTQVLESVCGEPSWRNAYSDIRGKLSGFGFDWQQGSTYFGNDTVDAVTCVIAVQDLTAAFPWFQPAVRDIRMLRIEENNDLMPAILRAAPRK